MLARAGLGSASMEAHLTGNVGKRMVSWLSQGPDPISLD